MNPPVSSRQPPEGSPDLGPQRECCATAGQLEIIAWDVGRSRDFTEAASISQTNVWLILAASVNNCRVMTNVLPSM